MREGTGGHDTDDVMNLARDPGSLHHPVLLNLQARDPSRSRMLSSFKRAVIDFPTVTFVYQAETKDHCLGNVIKGEGHSAGCC